LTKGAIAAAAGILVVGAGIALGDSKPDVLKAAQAIEVHAEPIAAFDKIDAQKTHFGKLTWRGGLVLTSPSPHFGGFSALALDEDGDDFLALSDAGTWMMGVLEHDGNKPKGLRAVRTAHAGRTAAGRSATPQTGDAAARRTPTAHAERTAVGRSAAAAGRSAGATGRVAPGSSGGTTRRRSAAVCARARGGSGPRRTARVGAGVSGARAGTPL
jgi:hypothetical protein